jgi:hypothetical protein
MRTPPVVFATSRALCIAGLVFALLVGARPAGAQPSDLTLRLTASHTRIAPGGTLRVTIGAVNLGPPVAADVYVVVLLPDGDSLVAPRGAAGFGFGRLSQLGRLAPLAAGVTLPTGFAQSLEDFVAYTFTGSEPPGIYRLYLAAVRPRALADGRVDGGDVLALATGQVTLGPPLSVTTDTARGASAEITPFDGGTVRATGADGITYTLVVPPGAVGTPTTVTLTPVTEVTGLPGLDAPLAGVHGGPAGLQFARPARLTIEVPGGVPPAAGLGLLIADDGSGAKLLPLLAGATRIELEMRHFSAVAIPATVQELRALFGSTGSLYEQGSMLLDTARRANPPNPPAVQFLLDHLLVWYDSHIETLLRAGQSQDLELLAGLEELLQWDILRVHLEDEFGDLVLGLSQVRGRLSARAVDGRTLVATGVAQAFVRANGRCQTGSALAARLADAESAARFALLARDYFSHLEQNHLVLAGDTDIPSPDLATHGLDEEAVATALCPRPAIGDVVVPSPGPGQSGTLTVEAGVSFLGGPLAFHPGIAVEFSPDPGGSGAPAGSPTARIRTNAAGRADFPVTAGPGGSVEFRVCGVFHPLDFPGLYASLMRESCRSSSGAVVVTPSQTTIAPGASRQFTAVVEGTEIQDVIWEVNGGGTISSSGLFTSNGTPGTFRIVATSVANPDPGAAGTALVTVTGSGGGGEEGPCPGGCNFSGTFMFCNRGTCSAPTSGSVTAVTFRPLPTNGRSGALSWVCSGALVSAELTRSGGSFTGIVTRTGGGACRDLGTTVNVPITGSVSASALAFVVQVAGSPTTTLAFSSTAAAASSMEKR